MKKKFVIIMVICMILALLVFYGCNSDAEITTAESTAASSQNETSEPVDTEEEESVSESQNAPDNTEENELEILTAPQTEADTKSTESADEPTEATKGSEADNTQGETKIELPFVPAQ